MPINHAFQTSQTDFSFRVQNSSPQYATVVVDPGKTFFFVHFRAKLPFALVGNFFPSDDPAPNSVSWEARGGWGEKKSEWKYPEYHKIKHSKSYNTETYEFWRLFEGEWKWWTDREHCSV